MAKMLDGKVAIVTGGAGGIGQVYARALAAEGASVVLADLNGEGAAEAAAQMESEGFSAMGARLDVTSEESAKAMVEQVKARFGGVDILVNNAGIMSAIPRQGLIDVPLAAYEMAMKVNATSVLICARAAVPSMLERGGGKIINQASTAAFEPGTMYRLSKHQVVAITAGLAKELGAKNINVNAIAPGTIQTEEGFRSIGPIGSDRRTARGAGVPNPIPDRPPETLIGTLLLLAGPGSDYINGQTIIVDGGRNMRL